MLNFKAKVGENDKIDFVRQLGSLVHTSASDYGLARMTGNVKVASCYLLLTEFAVR